MSDLAPSFRFPELGPSGLMTLAGMNDGTFRFGIFLTHVQGNRPTGPQHCNYLDCQPAPRFGLVRCGAFVGLWGRWPRTRKCPLSCSRAPSLIRPSRNRLERYSEHDGLSGYF